MFFSASGIKKEPDINEQLSTKYQCYDIDSDSNSSDSNTGKIKVVQNVTQESEQTQTPLLGNKIILGSKPTQPTKIESNERKQQNQDLSAAKIYLEDIGSYLSKSERFCKICLTIFPHKENFEIHKTTVHNQNTTCNENRNETRNKFTIGSVIKSYKCNECYESFFEHSLLRRHLINVHKKMFKKSLIETNHTSLPVSSPLRTRMVRSTKLNQCFHCKVSFSSKKLLIDHIYMVLQSKKGKDDSDPKVSKSEKLHKDQMKTTLRRPKRIIANKRNRPERSQRTSSRNKISAGKLIRKNIPVRRNKSEPFQRNVRKMQNNILIYQCVYCSYIFSNMNFCLKHILNKHKDSSISEVKAVKFDEQCKYCSKKNDNWKLHNIHMQQYHKQKIDRTIKVYPKICLPKVDNIMQIKQMPDLVNTSLIDNNFEESTETEMDMDERQYIEEQNEEVESNSVNNDQLLLKSILFKCMRCDIHFLSAKSAMNHAIHMELLINWKCLSCNKIFKKVDEKLHMKQHSISNTFTVFELTESQLTRILYKCSKCTIHFDANGYLPHFKKCEIAVAESVYCKVCDILIDKRISGSHKNYHNNHKNIKPYDFTIINADAVGAEPIQKTVVDSSTRKISKKTYGLRFCFKLSYCKTCNSFISKQGKSRRVHMESRCAHLPTYICRFCGLIFTNKAMGTHKMMHQERKGIKLQDFSFYNWNGKQILPPVPEYPMCKNCHVHFMSKNAVKSHLCGEDFLTCHLCNIKLSEPVFKLHMSFHYYSNTSKDLSQADTRDEKRTPRPPPRKREISAPGTSTNSPEFREPETNHSLNMELPVTCEANEMKTINLNNSNIECAKLVPEAVTDEGSNQQSTKSTNSHTINKTNQDHRKSDLVLFNVLYCCINCQTTIDTYDAVVEHCQEHLCGGEIKNIACETCKLKLDPKTYGSHKEFHALEATNKSFEVLKFDTFYFALDNSVWIKHIFQNIEDEKTQAILNRSIYKYGGKLKMQVIQEGSSDLTVYKCNSCFVIVDPDFVIKHVENSCFKTRKHPCSYCGLPFMSYISLKKHLSIHKKINISFKSYRIVIINQEKDKKSNKVLNGLNKYFLLYKCRKCNGVIDTYQRQNHTLCNDKDLKNCSVCDLLFYSADYKAHMQKHELVCNFVPKNMKIVLFGQSPLNKLDEKLTNQTNFDGTIVDFTFIQCVKCGVCLDKSPLETVNHHTCYEDSVLSKCSKCELYILKSKFARHSKLHDINAHFVKGNMNIIPYDHSEQLSKFVPANLNHLNDQEPGETKTGRNNKHLSNNMEDLNQTINSSHTAEKSQKISEKTVKLYKCSCGLHFMDKTSIDEHFDHCDTEKSKQHCSKCNLLFTPKVLFNHLLLHHGDKKNIYTFNIKEMSKKKNYIMTLYNCVTCKTHFLEYNKAEIHFENCKGFEVDRKECGTCKLFFSSCSFSQHETLHDDETVADVEIVEVTTKNDKEQMEKALRSIDNELIQADFVRESKYNMSVENLSQIDLSRYSNTIFKCETCNTHFLTQHTLKRHFANGKHVLPPQDTCNICELRFSLQSLTKHIYIHHKEMKLNSGDFVIISNV